MSIPSAYQISSLKTLTPRHSLVFLSPLSSSSIPFLPLRAPSGGPLVRWSGGRVRRRRRGQRPAGVTAAWPAGAASAGAGNGQRAWRQHGVLAQRRRQALQLAGGSLHRACVRRTARARQSPRAFRASPTQKWAQ
jgi:hypothetical protein